MRERLGLTVERLYGSGAYRVAAMIGGYRVERVYYGVGRSYAVRQFRAYVREIVAAGMRGVA